MQTPPLHVEFDSNSGKRLPDASHTAILAQLARTVVAATGAAIDLEQDAYRYDTHFVFRLHVTGLAAQASVALSSTAEPLAQEPFALLVADSVDALTLMEELRTQLRLASLPLLCSRAEADSAAPAGPARALALADVIRWHRARIAHYTAERARMAEWSRDNEGDPPGTLYDDYAQRIEEHQHMIARMAELSA